MAGRAQRLCAAGKLQATATFAQQLSLYPLWAPRHPSSLLLWDIAFSLIALSVLQYDRNDLTAGITFRRTTSKANEDSWINFVKRISDECSSSPSMETIVNDNSISTNWKANNHANDQAVRRTQGWSHRSDFRAVVIVTICVWRTCPSEYKSDVLLYQA